MPDQPDQPPRPDVPRHIPDPGFAGDDGSPDGALAEALAGWARGTATHTEVMGTLLLARVVVPVVAVATEVGQAPSHPALTTEKSTDMALVTLLDATGQRALPVFTGTAALAAWRPDARPVPAEAVRAALSALAEGAGAVVVDVAGPARYDVTGDRLTSLARGLAWVPAHEDPGVQQAVVAAVAARPALDGASVTAAPGGGVRVVLHPASGAREPDLRRAAQDVAGVLATADAVRERAAAGFELVVAPHA